MAGFNGRKDGVSFWLEPLKSDWKKIANVHGSLKELEKWVPTAGLAMIQLFFPISLRYDDNKIKDNLHKRLRKKPIKPSASEGEESNGEGRRNQIPKETRSEARRA